MPRPTPRRRAVSRSAVTTIVVSLAVIAAIIIGSNVFRPETTSLDATELLTRDDVLSAEATPSGGLPAVPTTPPIVEPTATPSPTVAPTPIPNRGSRSSASQAPDATSESPSDNLSELDEGTTTPVAVSPATPEPTEAPTTQPEPTPTVVVAPTPIPTPTPLPTQPPAATPTPTPTPRPPGMSPADMELYSFNQINQARAQAGVSPLTFAPEISAIARDWSGVMAASGGIAHRPAAELGAMLPGGWLAWGENVASAPDIYWAQSALEDSPGHYQNMINPAYTTVGIGVVVDASGQIWITQDFASY